MGFINAKRINVTVFEGSDCCGKTTQAKKLLRDAEFSECRIYIHFPRAYYKDVKKIYTDTMSTIYNNDFMSETFLNKTNEESEKQNYETLKNVLIDNIVVNAEEKISFLESLTMIVKRVNEGKKDYITATFNEWCHHQPDIYEMIIQNNGVSENISLKNIENFINKCNSLPLHFIIDRFDYSGQCYNLFIIQKVLEKYRTKDNSDKIDDLIFTLTELQNEKTKEIETWKFVLESIGVDIRYIFFKPSKRIEKMVMVEKTRETDDYDNCNYIREFGKMYFGKLASLMSENTNIKNTNVLVIDTDAENGFSYLTSSPREDYICVNTSNYIYSNEENIHHKILTFIHNNSDRSEYEQSKIITNVFTK